MLGLTTSHITSFRILKGQFVMSRALCYLYGVLKNIAVYMTKLYEAYEMHFKGMKRRTDDGVRCVQFYGLCHEYFSEFHSVSTITSILCYTCHVACM